MRRSSSRNRCAAAILTLTFALHTFPLSASAHGGRTDENGGHVDSSTGDYHYHHGYPAHAHFDIDGDGIIDCPYHFVDLTDHSSGNDTSSYSSGYRAGSKDGYTEGYSDGYKKGEADGIETGYSEGEKAAQAEYTKQLAQTKSDYEEAHRKEIAALKSSFRWITVLIVAVLFVAFCVYISRKKKAWNKESKRQAASLASAHDTQIKDLKASHDDEIKHLKAQILNLSALHNTHTKHLNTQLIHLNASHEAEVNHLNAQLHNLSASHEAEIKHLNTQLLNLKRFSLLDKIASNEDPSIQLPEGIHLRQSYTPIKGTASVKYPYGEYTVFSTSSGKKYHCKSDCVVSAMPMHFFDLPNGASPCLRCVPRKMRPQPLPEWYAQIRQKLDAESKSKTGLTQPYPLEACGYEPASPVSAPETLPPGTSKQ